jgi:nucleoside-diphosphate-sugar epimerase
VRGAEVNVIGTVNVFEAARNLGLNFVCYASSASVYGLEDPAHPEPITLYGVYKLACEGVAGTYWHEHGIGSLGLRPLIIYGPERDVGLSAGPSLACQAAAEGRPYTVPVTGHTDFVFVRDVAAAFAEAVPQRPEGAHALNVVGESASIADFVDELTRQKPDAQINIEGPVMPVVGTMEGPDVRDLLPGVPRTKLTDGIGQTLTYYADGPR